MDNTLGTQAIKMAKTGVIAYHLSSFKEMKIVYKENCLPQGQTSNNKAELINIKATKKPFHSEATNRKWKNKNKKQKKASLLLSCFKDWQHKVGGDDDWNPLFIQMKVKAIAKIIFVSLFQSFENQTGGKISFHLKTGGKLTRIRKERLWRTAPEQVENNHIKS